MKPSILCVIGESGSGKTYAAEFMAKNYNVSYILSYTDRPKRNTDESGHTFISSEEFDKINSKDMIAYTDFGGYRYCATKQQIKDTIPNIYVIDEDGLKVLEEKYSDEYEIISLRIWRPNINVDEDRKKRNLDKFILPLNYFDHQIHNEGTLEEFEQKIKRVIQNI